MQGSEKKPIAKHIKDKASFYGKNLRRKKISYLHRLFRNKGSGFYGVGYIITLLYLEATAFIEEVSEFSFSFDNVLSRIISHLISFSIETVINFIKATIWPFIVYSNLNQNQAIAFLGITVTVYYFANKKWNFYQIYETKFGNHLAPEINQAWEQNNPNFGDAKAPNAIDFLQASEKEVVFSELIEKARLQQLDNWRHQPDSCFALLVLLQVETVNQQYCEEIIAAAIEQKLDLEMSPKQRFYFYSPIHNSESKKLQKIAKKSFSKLRKALPRSETELLDTLIGKL